MKVCSSCCLECYDKSEVVKCGGWYENSKETNSCTYWIHKTIKCCQTVDNVNYCPNCFQLQQSNISDETTRSEMMQQFREYLSDDDSISYDNNKAEDKSVARTVISESCKTVAEKLKKKYPSLPFSPPKDIVLENSSDNALENDDEYEESSLCAEEKKFIWPIIS